MEIVVGQAYGTQYPTILYVTEQRAFTVDLNRDVCLQGWHDVRSLARKIMADDRWSPNPSALCGWCPYVDMCSANQLGVGWLDIADQAATRDGWPSLGQPSRVELATCGKQCLPQRRRR